MKGLICFDLDNTLLYSDKAHADAYNKALVKLGYRKRSFNEIVKLLGKPHSTVVKILSKERNKNKIRNIMKEHERFIKKECYKKVIVIKGIKEALKKLKKKYRMAVISNASHKTILSLLKGARINKKLFDAIVGYDEVKRSKPWPDEIFKAEKLVKHEADYMVGDSIYDIIAGKEARVKVIAVLTGHYSKKILEKHKPYKILKSVRELPDFLESEDKNKRLLGPRLKPFNWGKGTEKTSENLDTFIYENFK